MSDVRLRTDDVAWRRVDDSVVVLDLRSQAYYELNSSGALLWELVADAQSSSKAMTERLMEVFDVDEHVASADVRGFLESLDQAGFLEDA